MEQRVRVSDPEGDLPRRRHRVWAQSTWAFGDLGSRAGEPVEVWGILTVIRPAGV